MSSQKPSGQSSTKSSGSNASNSHKPNSNTPKGSGVNGRNDATANETMLTRDFIDVDMLSAEEGQEQKEHGHANAVRLKY